MIGRLGLSVLEKRSGTLGGEREPDWSRILAYAGLHCCGASVFGDGLRIEGAVRVGETRKKHFRVEGLSVMVNLTG